MKKLQKNIENKILTGVCSGLAQYLGIDPTIVRLIFVILCFFTKGIVVLVYIAAAFLMPSSFLDDLDRIEDGTERKADNLNNMGSDPQTPEESRSNEDFNSFFK